MSSSSASSPPMDRKYKGVRRRKWGKWVSEIRLPNSRERIWLGSYDSPEEAARAFDAAFVCLRGHGGAGLNFPDSPPRVDGGRCRDPQRIQAAALAHASRTAAATPSPGSGSLLPMEVGSPATTATSSTQSEEVAAGDLDGGTEVVPPPMQQGHWGGDWPPVMTDQPPLFSPTQCGHSYEFFPTPPPPPAEGAEEDDVASSSCLWCFD